MTIDAALGPARARRWWVSGRRVRSLDRAASFVGDVGFALLFPSDRVFVPSLWEAVAAADAEPFATGMEGDEQRVWTWKDELPRRRLAWYGNFVAGRGSFLSPTLLRLLYPGAGEADDHLGLDLSPTAHQLADALAAGPLASAELRALVGRRSSYERAAAELQRALLVTKAGVEEKASGWPSSVLDLTCHRFPVGGGTDHVAAAGAFVDVVLDTSAAELGRSFRWPAAYARETLDDLADSGRAVRADKRYRSPTLFR